MYKVMIVGHGFVGSAIASLFSDEEKVIVDPKFTDNKISDNPGIPVSYTHLRAHETN